MNKCQSSVLAIIILMGIIISLVSVTYIWAGPLISKNIDKSSVEKAMDFMTALNDDILYVASTGASRALSVNLGQASLVIDSSNNQVVVEMSSSVQMINSVAQVPLNFAELAMKSENFNINASLTDTNTIISGYESTSHYTNFTLAGSEYNASLFNSSATHVFDLLCLWNTTVTEANDCAQLNESISKNGTAYEVTYINESGSTASFIGGLIENKGVFSLEPAGIISAKGFSVSDKEYITLYLTYRALTSSENVDFKIILDCLNNCAFTNENKNLIISRTNIERESGSVNTYINIEVS